MGNASEKENLVYKKNPLVFYPHDGVVCVNLLTVFPFLFYPDGIYRSIAVPELFAQKVDDVSGLYFIHVVWIHGLVVFYPVYFYGMIHAELYPAGQRVEVFERKVGMQQGRSQHPYAFALIAMALCTTAFVGAFAGVLYAAVRNKV